MDCLLGRGRKFKRKSHDQHNISDTLIGQTCRVKTSVKLKIDLDSDVITGAMLSTHLG